MVLRICCLASRRPIVFPRLQDGVVFLQNNSKDLDPSYKTDLDLWDRLGRVKLVLQQNFIRLIWLFEVILERSRWI